MSADEERIGRVEEAIVILKDLVVNHDERLDDYFRALRESREDFEFKMNALIDSQIRTEAELIELRRISESHSRRIENLENK